MRRKKKLHRATRKMSGITQPSTSADPAAGDLAGVLHAVLLEILDQLGILDADGGEAARPLSAACLSCPRMRSSRDGDLLHLALANEGLELAVGDRLAGLDREEERLAERQQEQKAEHVPHRRAAARCAA